jgi:hypothetical protein
MRKFLSFVLASAATVSFAANPSDSVTPPANSNPYSAFQQFDREYNLGYSIVSGNVSNGKSNGVYNSQAMNLEVERLFDLGVWMDVSASLLTYYSQAADPSLPSLGTTTGSQPNFGGVNAKVGYAFPLIKDTLLLTPYGLVGRNTNLSSYTLVNSGQTTNLTQDYFWTAGVGARLEYRLDHIFDFYLDQSAAYNASQAPTVQGLAPNNNYAYTTTLGAKFNLYRNFQLGAKAFYTNYYFTQGLTTVTPAGVASVPTNELGGMLSIGLTY